MHPALAGVLSQVPLEHLLLHLSEKKLRGALLLHPEGLEDLARRDALTFVEGKPAKIRVADAIEPLGEVLVELGVVAESTHAEAMRALQAGAGLLGEILLRAGKIDRATLAHALREQLSRKLVRLFALSGATRWAFYPDVDALAFHGGPELFPCEVAPIVFAGLRAHPSPHVDATLDKLAGTPLRVKKGMDLRSLSLSPDERDLTGLLRVSPMSVEQLEGAGVLGRSAARSLAYALVVLGAIEPVTTTVTTPAPRAPSTEAKALQKISSAPVVKIALRRMTTSKLLVEQGGGDGREESAAPSSTRRRIAAVTGDPRRAELRERAASLVGKANHEVLGVSENATAREIESAFVASAARWRPDALPPELADLRAECELIWARIVEAHAALLDADRRRRAPH